MISKMFILYLSKYYKAIRYEQGILENVKIDLSGLKTSLKPGCSFICLMLYVQNILQGLVSKFEVHWGERFFSSET